MKENIHISATDSMSLAWAKFKEQWQTLATVMVIMFAVSALFSLANWMVTRSYTNDIGQLMAGTPASIMFGSAAIQIISVIFSIYFGFNTMMMTFRILDGKKVEVLDLFKTVTGTSFWRWLGASILIGIVALLLLSLSFGVSMFLFNLGISFTFIFALGLLVCAMLAVYFIFRYMFATYLIADGKENKIMDAFKKSSEMTEGIKLKLFWNFFLIGLISLAIVIAGLIALIVGVIPAAIIASWISSIATIHIYRSVYAQRFAPKELIEEVVEEEVVVENSHA